MRQAKFKDEGRGTANPRWQMGKAKCQRARARIRTCEKIRRGTEILEEHNTRRENQASLRNSFISPIGPTRQDPSQKFVLVACRVLLTFPSAVECVSEWHVADSHWKPQCHPSSSHSRVPSDSIAVIPAMPRRRRCERPGLWRLQGKRWHEGAALAKSAAGASLPAGGGIREWELRMPTDSVSSWHIVASYRDGTDQTTCL